jgi:hypothetical protein
MSKASEWAKQIETKRPKFRSESRDYTRAYVNDDGWLRILDTGPYLSDEAIALARWILDTFGEEQGGD